MSDPPQLPITIKANMTTSTQCTTDDDTSVYDYILLQNAATYDDIAYMTSRYYPVQLPMMILYKTV